MIIKNIPVGPLGANCFIIGDKKTKVGAIIDPGAEPENILELVKEMGLTIKYVILTHGHFDHVGGVKGVMEGLDAQLLVHKEDEEYLLEAPSSAARWGLSVDGVVKATNYFEDGEVVDVGELKLEVIHTPGHTPGGVCIYIKSEKVVFAGDTLFFRSIGRTDFRGGSYEDIEKSIKKRLYVLPDETVVYTGHGEETTIGDEKHGNMVVRA